MGQMPNSGMPHADLSTEGNEFPPVPASTLDASGAVRIDAPCRKCAYNVRGLRVEGRCPECGTPVRVSLHGDLIRFSMPDWVETLHRGARIIVYTIVMMGLAIILGLVADRSGNLGWALHPLLVAWLAISAGWVFFIIGAWHLTAPDPSRLGEGRYGTARNLARVGLVVGISHTFLDMAAMYQGMLLSPLRVIAGLAGFVWLMGHLALLHHLSKVALRIPDTALSRQARLLLWAIGLSYGSLLVLGSGGELLMSLAGPPTGLRGAMVVLDYVYDISFIAMIALFVMYLFMMRRFADAFRQQAQYARQVWAGAM
jgi:hypothetical protein